MKNKILVVINVLAAASLLCSCAVAAEASVTLPGALPAAGTIEGPAVCGANAAASTAALVGAESTEVADVARGTLFGSEVTVVLRDRGLEHRRAEVRRIAQILGPGVIGPEQKAGGEPPLPSRLKGVIIRGADRVDIPEIAILRIRIVPLS